MPVDAVDAADGPRYPCLCCGHRTLPVPPSGTWLTCPVCLWTDEELNDDAARTRLVEAQRSFERIGASAPACLDDVRAPTAAEARAEDWRPPSGPSPRELARRALQAQIREAFAGVTFEGRITLTDSYRQDYYTAPKIDWDDHDHDWTRIPIEVLDFFGRGTTPFVFGNEQSFRYYMPAFMIRSIDLGTSLAAVHALDAPLSPGRSPDELPVVRILDADQRAAIVRFLEYVALYEAPAPWAERALDRVWRPVSPMSPRRPDSRPPDTTTS